MPIPKPSDAMRPPKTSAVFDQAFDKAFLTSRDYGEELDGATLTAIANDAQDAAVFGADAPKGRDGKRIQQGIGSKGHETANHFFGIRRWEGEAKYQAAIRKMWRDNPERAKLIGLEMPERLGS